MSAVEIFAMIGVAAVTVMAFFAVILLICAIRHHIEWHDYVEETLDWLVKKAKESEKTEES